MFRRLTSAAAVMLLAVALSGCATQLAEIKATVAKVEAVVSGTVKPAVILLAINSFDALEATAKNYIDPRLNKRCDGTNGPICRDPTATIAINKAMLQGRAARNAAKKFLRDHPGELGTEGVYDALQLGIGTLQSIFTNYNIGS